MRRLGVFLALRWRALTGTASAATVALGLLACLCTLLAVVGPRAAAQLRTAAFRQFIAAAPATDKTVTGSIDDSAMGTGESGGLSASQMQRAAGQLRRNLRGLPLGPAAEDWFSLTTPPVVVTDHATAAQSALPPKLELTYRDTLASNVRLVAGRLPVGGGSAATLVQVAVTRPTARRFGLAIGSRLPLPGTGTVLAVTGIVQPRDAAAPFWTVDPVAAAPAITYVGSYAFWLGAAFISADAVSTLQARFNMAATQITWMFPLRLGQLTAAQAGGLQEQLAGALATAGQLTAATRSTASRCSATGPSHTKRGQNFRVSVHCSPARSQVPLSIAMASGTASLLAEFDAEAASVGSVLDLFSVSLAVLAATVVLLAGWLLAEQRRGDFAVLRARGAGRRQLGVAVLVGSAVTVLPGAAVGAAIGVLLTPSSSASLSWWLAGLEVLACLAGPMLITVLLHRDYAPIRLDQSQGRLAAARRLITESALVLGAAGGLIVLREQGLGTGGGDVYPSAAPALLAIGVAVIVLRAYPPAVRGLLRLTGRRTGATAFLGLARAARAPASAVLPVFALVLALALVSFAGMVRGAVARGEVTASWQQTGADAVISNPDAVSSALQRSVADVAGVQHVAAVGVAVGSLASVGQFSVLLVDPARYAAVVAAGPLPQPPSTFTSRAASRTTARPAPVLASPGLAAKVGSSPFTVLLDGEQLIRMRVVGQAPAMSAVAATSAGYLVLDRRAAAGLGVGLGLVPDALLVAGQHLDQSSLLAVVARHAPGATIVLRSRLLARLAAAPLRHGADLALALGAAVAACCCLLVLLLSLLLSASARQQALARLGTMGLSAAQARLLALIELLPQLLAVVAGGLVCAVVLVPALGPALSLAVFTGSATPVPVRVEPAWLAGTAIVLLALAIATLAAQTMVASRGAPRSLRMGG